MKWVAGGSIDENDAAVEFSAVLGAATAAITADYFRLAIVGGGLIYRERVYCYELYHQMRKIWNRMGGRLTLSGEVDKAGHPLIKRGGIPDFLVHVPGDMDGNDTIIEAKPCDARTSGLEKDIETLERFTHEFGYRRAIYLIYGHKINDRFLARIERAFERKAGQGPIELWLHRNADQAAQMEITLRG